MYAAFVVLKRNQMMMSDQMCLPKKDLQSYFMSLHLQHTNYIASIWKLSSIGSLTLPDISDHEWNENSHIKWI